MTTPDLPELVQRCQTVLAHAWMVRTFVKHSPEAEDFPELMAIARTVFDVSRALETRIADPASYFHMLGKKIHRLRQAADQFAADAPQASTHTNFVQAVISIRGSVEELEALLAVARGAVPGKRANDLTSDDDDSLASDVAESELSPKSSAGRDTET